MKILNGDDVIVEVHTSMATHVVDMLDEIRDLQFLDTNDNFINQAGTQYSTYHTMIKRLVSLQGNRGRVDEIYNETIAQREQLESNWQENRSHLRYYRRVNRIIEIIIPIINFHD